MQKSRSILLQLTHWLQKGLFRKIDNITFAYLFRLTILQHFKQIFVAVIRLHNFGSNLVQIAQFPQEIFFWENWMLLLPTYCVLSSCNISKKSSDGKSWNKVAQFWLKVGPSCPFYQTGIFWKSYTILL